MMTMGVTVAARPIAAPVSTMLTLLPVSARRSWIQHSDGRAIASE